MRRLALLLVLLVFPTAAFATHECFTHLSACGTLMNDELDIFGCTRDSSGWYYNQHRYYLPDRSVVTVILNTTGFTPELGVFLGGQRSYAEYNANTQSSTRLVISDLLIGPGDLNVDVIGKSFGTGRYTIQVHCTACSAPVITAQPQATSVRTGGQAQLTVAASGTSLAYGWFDVADPLVQIGDGPTLTTPPLTRSATYRVSVRSPCGTVESQPVTVTVTTPRRRTFSQ